MVVFGHVVFGWEQAGRVGESGLHLHINRFRDLLDPERELLLVLAVRRLIGRWEQGGRGGEWRSDLHIEGLRGELDSVREQPELAVRSLVGGCEQTGRGGVWRSDLHLHRNHNAWHLGLLVR